jgi:predicted aconitase with swiveling domain
VGRVVTFFADVIVGGTGSGIAVVTDEPISFWGGLDPHSGEIIDRRHPLSGQKVAGKVLVMPHGRGSCSASGVLLEAIRNGFAPAAIVVSRVDPIIGLGSILGDELYDRSIPVLRLKAEQWTSLRSGDFVEIEPSGRIVVTQQYDTAGER